jgi:hypothetical protein
MKRILRFAGVSALFLAAMPALLQGGPQPVWTLNIEETLALRSFESQMNLTWSKQQDVVFLTPERVLLYQVNQLREPARLAGRDANGGGGNFFLEIRILDVRDGRLVKTHRLPTSAGFSKILPTHDGKMIVRTGDSLFLCTEEFQPLASRTLPIKGDTPIEVWQLGVSPSGRQVVLVHQQIKPAITMMDEPAGQFALSEIEVLDADTLKTVKAFSVAHPLSTWSVSDNFLVVAGPSPMSGGKKFGFLDFEGKWAPFAVKNDRCNYQMDALPEGYIAAYGCGRIAVVDANGQKLFSHDVSGKDFVGSMGLAGRYLALELAREVKTTIPGTNFPIMTPKSERLDVYDRSLNKLLLSLLARSENLYYEISAAGTLLVVDGSSLAMYRLEN